MNLLTLLVRKVYKNEDRFQTTDNLKITDAWNKITAEHRKSLVDSMEQQIFYVIKKSEGSIKYK